MHRSAIRRLGCSAVRLFGGSAIPRFGGSVVWLFGGSGENSRAKSKPKINRNPNQKSIKIQNRHKQNPSEI
jgi:hypothetical protein